MRFIKIYFWDVFVKKELLELYRLNFSETVQRTWFISCSRLNLRRLFSYKYYQLKK